ncbi:MAG TPA: DUF819 family protein [Candidatus Omnitrophota bacterium]|nr:DUF819 family protein [Candidatus Omnitrophota bacterium]HPS19684.1 DUF819 family protein [Candidatus Omnitrophota bacterium]
MNVGNFYIITVLVAIEGAIYFLSGHNKTKWFFNIIPSMFWIYFIPLLASTLGLIPSKSDLYKLAADYLLPVSLVLILMSVNIKQIFRLGPKAIAMMLAGSLGIFIGGPVVILLFKDFLPSGIWSGFGAIAASWTGGSANMLAVKEAISTPDAIFMPMVIVDAIVPYLWMGLLIVASNYQTKFDKWNKADIKMMKDLNNRIKETVVVKKRMTVNALARITAVGIVSSFVAIYISSKMPVVKNIVSAYTWTIVIITAIGMGLSFTKIKGLESYGSSQIGYFLLYFVLATIGARANLAALRDAPVLIIAGIVWVMIHGVVLLSAARLVRAPLFLVATASQANIGGTASAPVVAAIYQPLLAPVGLLLAVMGNIMGTYVGILCAEMCRKVAM